jgi:hypothetical protein
MSTDVTIAGAILLLAAALALPAIVETFREARAAKRAKDCHGAAAAVADRLDGEFLANIPANRRVRVRARMERLALDALRARAT